MWRACSSDLNLPIIPYDSILLNDNKFVQHRNQKKTGHWLAVVKREKEKNLRGGGMACFSCCWSFFLFLLFSYIFFSPLGVTIRRHGITKKMNSGTNICIPMQVRSLFLFFLLGAKKKKERKKEGKSISHTTRRIVLLYCTSLTNSFWSITR